jgi:hypothetical protein
MEIEAARQTALPFIGRISALYRRNNGGSMK